MVRAVRRLRRGVWIRGLVVLVIPFLVACRPRGDPLSSVRGGSTVGTSGWGYLDAKVFTTGRNRLYYAISTASQEFEPMDPPPSVSYTYSVDRGGALQVDGRSILPSPDRRLLARSPFGGMEEILLTQAEGDVVLQGDPVRIWEEVVLPRLAIVDGKTVDGLRVGHWIVSGKSGVKGYEGDYVDGKREGEWTYYFSDGKRRATVRYRRGLLHGALVEVDRNGQETRRVEWKDNFPVGGPQTWKTLGSTITRTPEGVVQGSNH
jgi:hypothetical protein